MITKNIWKTIKKYEIITIFRHIYPDGDAIGSQLGLKKMILKMFPNKKVYCLGEQSLHWGKLFETMDENVPNETIRNSLAIVLDVADARRVDDNRFLTAKEVIKIDHHIFVEKLGTNIDYVDTSYSACCEMIAELAYDNKVKMDKDIALPLFTGLVTDSGRFMFSSTTYRTMDLASKLVSTGIDFVSLYAFLYAQDKESVRFKGYCQSNFKETDNGVAYNIITKEIQKEFNISENQGAGVVNVLSNINGIKIWAHFSIKDDGTVKAEFRSSGLPVNSVAAKYGGGGHKQASGATLENASLIENVINDLDELCKE